MREERKRTWDGCALPVAKAMSEFYDRWGPYSSKSRTRSIFALFEQLIEPAWIKYLRSLPLAHPGRLAYDNLSLSEIARKNGFYELGKTIDEIAKLKRYEPTHHDLEFAMTYESLRQLVLSCESKRGIQVNAKFKGSRKDRQPGEFCRFCGNNTELFVSYRDEQRTGDASGLDGENKLSATYCKQHRPINWCENGGVESIKIRNLKYITAARKNAKAQFDTELSRLMLQCTSTTEFRAGSGNSELDEFYLRIINRSGYYLDEKSLLRNEARRLVDYRVDDTKKRIIILRRRGISHVDIANMVGMRSRQAVHKALESVSINSGYRFDCKPIGIISG